MRASPISFAEGALTRQRREVKLLLGAEELSCLQREPAWREHALLAPETCVTSVYFDRPDHALTARALAAPDDCLKLRTKEYAPDHGADGATPRVVIEAKRERHGSTSKRRAWVARSELGLGPGRLLASAAVEPVLAVTYLRRIHQHASTWRITEDRQIAFHVIGRAQALGPDALLPERLPTPFAREERVVLEVKFTALEDLPGWLATLCEGRGARYSKFAEGMGQHPLAPSEQWARVHREEALGRVH